MTAGFQRATLLHASAYPGEVGTGSPTRICAMLESRARSDSIGTEHALGGVEASDGDCGKHDVGGAGEGLYDFALAGSGTCFGGS
jgi:hypothetical protein